MKCASRTVCVFQLAIFYCRQKLLHPSRRRFVSVFVTGKCLWCRWGNSPWCSVYVFRAMHTTLRFRFLPRYATRGKGISLFCLLVATFLVACDATLKANLSVRRSIRIKVVLMHFFAFFTFFNTREGTGRWRSLILRSFWKFVCLSVCLSDQIFLKILTHAT